MKAKEAPKKIYIFENPILDFTKLSIRQSETDIEYTRTDAFIKKACDAYCKVCGHYVHTTPNHICRQTCVYYKNFVNYMRKNKNEA